MNYRANIVRVFAAATVVIECLCVALPAPAQVPTGPIVPLKKMEFKKVDPLGGANLPSVAPGDGSTYYPDAGASQQTGVSGRGSAYYPDAAASQQTGVRGGGSAYSCPGTARQPIRGRGGFRQY